MYALGKMNLRGGSCPGGGGGDRNAQYIPLFALVTILLSRGCRDRGAAWGAEGVTGSGPREESGARLRGGEAPADKAHRGQPQS